MATSINLAPGTQYIMAAQQRRQRLYALSLGIAILVILGWIGLAFYKWRMDTALKDTNARLTAVEGEISKLDTDARRIVLFEQRLKNLDQLLKAHVSWNPVLAELEKLLPATTVLNSINTDSTQNTITVTGTTPDVDQVAVTLASLKNATDHKTMFSRANITNITRQEQKNPDGTSAGAHYQFGAELTFDPKVLYVNQ